LLKSNKYPTKVNFFIAIQKGKNNNQISATASTAEENCELIICFALVNTSLLSIDMRLLHFLLRNFFLLKILRISFGFSFLKAKRNESHSAMAYVPDSQAKKQM